MTPDKTQLEAEDFPLQTNGNSLTTKNGEVVATVPTPGLADDLAMRLNDDAARRHEGLWSA
jgi:hypothetical protein